VQSLNQAPIKQKLTGIVFVTCATAISLACAILAAYDTVMFRRSLEDQLASVAAMTGSNAGAALQAADPGSARHALSLLREQRQIVAACLYGRDEAVIATYVRRGSAAEFTFPRAQKDAYRVHSGYAELFRTIRFNREAVGAIYLKSDFGPSYGGVFRFAQILVVMMLVSLATAYFMSTNLQKIISDPILELARTAFTVSVHKDYSIRATRRSKDEIGFLFDRFNEMLQRIQEHETALQRAHSELENRVDERTRELQNEVSERCQAQRILAERTIFLNSLIETSPLAIAVINSSGKLQMCNPAFESLFEYTREEAIGCPIEELLGSANDDSAGRLAKEVEEGKQVHIITQRKRSNGSPVDVELYKVRLIVEDQAIGILAIYQDITERIRVEQELRRAKESAEAGSKAKSEFLANMSHEIRTPMNGILGMTELALDTPLRPDQREYLTMVKSSADSLLGVLNDILDFSKIEAGKLGLEQTSFSLRKSMGEMMKTLIFRARQNRLELKWSVSPDVPDILTGDEGRLRQVIVNLVGNALKFTPRGEVTVDVAIERKMDEAAVLHFRVKDTGIGIPPEKQQLIFEPFTQADSSTTRKFGGTGLGLGITSRLVQMMQGKLWVESEVNRGSTFHFTAFFDVSQNRRDLSNASEQRTCVLKSATTAGKAERMKVLLAEDNAVNRVVAERMLAKRGHSVFLASNGREALECLARREDIDAILMDVQMPEMDGLSTIQAIRCDEKKNGRHVPIVALTAHAMKGDREKCLQAGADDYLTKPVTSSALFAALDRVRKVAGRNGSIRGASRSDPATRVIDLALALQRLDGDRDLLAELVHLFADDWPKTSAEINAALVANDARLLERCAHSLKAASANLGADGLSSRLLELERLARDSNLVGASVQWEAVRKEVAEIIDELESLFRRALG